MNSATNPVAFFPLPAPAARVACARCGRVNLKARTDGKVPAHCPPWTDGLCRKPAARVARPGLAKALPRVTEPDWDDIREGRAEMAMDRRALGL